MRPVRQATSSGTPTANPKLSVPLDAPISLRAGEPGWIDAAWRAITAAGRVHDLIADHGHAYAVVEAAGSRRLIAVATSGDAERVLVDARPTIVRLAQNTRYLFYVGGDGLYRVGKL